MSEQSDDQERTPPEKVRVTGLQEASLRQLVRHDYNCAAMHWEVGVPQEDLQPLDETAIARLPRTHGVLVAEADHEPAGYLVWADEAPGVAVLEILRIGMEYQRFGIGRRLLRELASAASNAGLEHVVAVAYDKAPWAMSFLAASGFFPVAAGKLPEKITQWQEQRREPLAGAGQSLWWRKVDGLGTIPGLPKPT